MARPRLSRPAAAFPFLRKPLVFLAAALPILAALPLTVATGAAPATAATAATAAAAAAPGEGVLLFVVDRVSFEELMAVRQFRALARRGGAALMTTRVGSGDRTRSSYLTIGAGSIVPDGGIPFLMARTLRSHGLQACLSPDLPLPLLRAGPARLLLGPPGPGLVCSPQGVSGSTAAGEVRPAAVVYADSDTYTLDALQVGRGASLRARDRAVELRNEGSALERVLRGYGSGRVLVMVVTPLPSIDAVQARDETTPLVVASGRADRLLPAGGRMHALTSDTTRIDGAVSNLDVAPTVLRSMGAAVPAAMDGHAIRVLPGAAPPFALHQRHLEYRRTYVPVQVGEGAFVAFVGIVAALSLLWVRRRGSLPDPANAAVRFLLLCAVALPISLVVGGLLPRFTYGWILPWVGLTTPVLARLASRRAAAGAVAPFRFLAGILLAFVVLDLAFLGGRAFRFPLFGGTALDGVRYYGLPNALISMVLASALFVAWSLRRRSGFALLAGTALVVGLPDLGADIGGAITLFAAAGLWLALRDRPRGAWRGPAQVVATVVGGTAVVLAANRFLPGAPTHITQFVRRAQSGPGSALGHVAERLGAGAHQIAAYPPAAIPLAGLVALGWLVFFRVRPLDRGLALAPGWREVLLALVLSCGVAYLANDTGAAAAGPGFLYAMAGVAYPTLLAARGRPSPRPARVEAVAAGPA